MAGCKRLVIGVVASQYRSICRGKAFLSRVTGMADGTSIYCGFFFLLSNMGVAFSFGRLLVNSETSNVLYLPQQMEEEVKSKLILVQIPWNGNHNRMLAALQKQQCSQTRCMQIVQRVFIPMCFQQLRNNHCDKPARFFFLDFLDEV